MAYDHWHLLGVTCNPHFILNCTDETLWRLWHGDQDMTEEAEAGLHLLAAAPDLLAACEKVYNAINWRCTAERLSQLKQADILRDAIEKAKGV